MVLDQIANIINAIADLPLKEALKFLKAKNIVDLGKTGYEKIREIIRTKNSEKKFGFVPNKDEANFLTTVSKKPHYTEFNSLIPNSKYSDFIRIGYLVRSLNKKGNHHRYPEISEYVAGQPNGAHLIKVVNLVTTDTIVPVLDYLLSLKRKNYDSAYIKSAFDSILNDWMKISYFVRAEFSEDQIYREVKTKLSNKQKIIMVFSYGSANENTTRAIAKVQNEGLAEDYSYSSKNDKEGEKKVHSSTFTLREQ